MFFVIVEGCVDVGFVLIVLVWEVKFVVVIEVVYWVFICV